MTTVDLTSARARNVALALLALTQFMVVIDAAIVNVALPSLGRDLAFSRNALSWVVTSYVLAFGGLLLLGGRLADALGRRRVFVIGIAVFTAASLAAGLAQGVAWLLVARAVQGASAALVSPAALSIVTTTFTDDADRNRALGIWGSVGGAGGAVGVLLGGVLTDVLDWRWIFFINVPLGLVALTQAPRRLLESRGDTGGRFDILGALSGSAGLTMLVYAFTQADQDGWTSASTFLRGGAGIVLLLAFVLIEYRANTPIVRLSIFRSRLLSGANAVQLLVGVSLFSTFFFYSLYLQQVLDYSPLKTGVAYLPLSIVIVIAATGTSQLVTRIGVRPTLVGGLAFTAAGMWWFSRIGPEGTFWKDALGPSIISGIGFGAVFVSVTIAALADVKPHDAGLASGLINTTQQVGGALGLAVLAAIANDRTGNRLATHAPPLTALSDGFGLAFLISGGVAVLAAIVALLVIRTGAPVSPQPQETSAPPPASSRRAR